MRVRATVAMVVAILAAAAGNVMLSHGMKTVGALSAYGPEALWTFFTSACLNPWVIGGIGLQLANYLLWLAVLSWAEVSWATPLNAIEYVLVGLGAAAFLGERVGPVRWLGIVLIVFGVSVMVDSWEHTVEDPPEPVQPEAV
ncbi:MAG: EamA family transporter [Elusimicrobia bacterium]|nr:EamA family transporter [Elusimicrobiota bacterium]